MNADQPARKKAAKSAPPPVTGEIRAAPRGRPPASTVASGTIEPPPRWREHVLPVLYPLPGGELAARRGWLRAAFWFGLALLFAAGVVAPYLLPESVRRWTQPAARPALVAAGAYPPGTRLRDCGDGSCPWLVVVPAGRFMMGSPADEKGREPDEGPQHQVVIPSAFALMEAEVTRGEFAAFVQETNYEATGGCYTWTGQQWDQVAGADWRKPGFEQTDQHPVVCVNWHDAQAYARWLSARTGQRYRLPSEAEWEYAARAGSTSRFFFGDRDEDLCSYANVGDRTTRDGFKGWNKKWVAADCADGYVYTAPAKSFKPNAFGLYDVAGNAWEWTQDCWHDGYEGGLGQGEAWETGCSDVRRVVRGGGWYNNPQDARSANRDRDAPGNRNDDSGFRLARTLSP